MSRKVKIIIVSLVTAIIATISIGGVALAANGNSQAGDCPNCTCDGDCGDQNHNGFDNCNGKAQQPGSGEGTGTQDGDGMQYRWGQ